MWTLSSLQMHPHPMIVVDEDATLELQVKTVKVRCMGHCIQVIMPSDMLVIVFQEYRKGWQGARDAPEAPQKARLAT